MLFTYAPSVSQAQRDAIFLRMQAEGLVGCAMSALAAPTLADWRRITSPRRGLLLCCHAAEAGDSLEHFAFETVPGSTHHSGENHVFRQNPRHVVAAAAFASAEQFQREIALDQIAFEMLHISKVSFSRKCDLRLNPRHVVARCTFVQR